MNENILNLVIYIVTIIFGALITYFKTNAKLKEKTSQYIVEAENEYSELSNVGKEKFEIVVNKLYLIVPIYLKPIITRDVISNLVQQTFNSIQSYAKTQIDKYITPNDDCNIESEDGR